MTIEDEYRERCATASDINEHMPALCALAEQCAHVTEFGTRTGNSTVALLAGCARVVSYDHHDCRSLGFDGWEFHQADTAHLADIEPTDLLFIDTLHDAAQVAAELVHARRVRRFLVFHDTVLFGSADESGRGPGIMHAVLDFLAHHHEWRVRSHDPANNGLLVLERS